MTRVDAALVVGRHDDVASLVTDVPALGSQRESTPEERWPDLGPRGHRMGPTTASGTRYSFGYLTTGPGPWDIERDTVHFLTPANLHIAMCGATATDERPWFIPAGLANDGLRGRWCSTCKDAIIASVPAEHVSQTAEVIESAPASP